MTISEELNLLKGRIQDAYSACQEKNAVMPSVQDTWHLSSCIASIANNLDSGEIPEGVAVDGVKWTSEWETKGAQGTIVDIVVGDELSYRLETNVTIGQLVASVHVVIDWGDGTTTTTTQNSTTTQSYSHKYAQAGHYIITIDNNAGQISFGSQNYSTSIPTLSIIGQNNNRNSIRRVRQFGSNLKVISYIFGSCYWLNSEEGGYPGDLPPIPPNVTSMAFSFYSCNHYNGPLPYIGHLDKCTTFTSTFAYMRNAIGTVQKFPTKVATVANAYQGCCKLSSVPYDLFPDNLSATLTNATYALDSVGCYQEGQAAVIKFPKISHLTKVSTMAYMFQSCRIFTGDLPELPAGNALTSTASMYSSLYSPIKINQNYFTKCTNLKVITSMFYNCYELIGECPTLPTTLTAGSLSSTFYSCNLLGGTFPAIPTNYTGTLYNTFYNCYSITGSLPAIPAGVNDLRSAFFGCVNATGKIPDLGEITNISNASYVTQVFYNCRNVSQPPATWFNSTITAKITSFSGMFAYCYKLKSFPFDLDTCTATTVDCQQMFRDCYSLTTGPKKLPPNVTTTSYMFSNCYMLKDSPIHIGTYSKLTTIPYMYWYCHNLYPMVDDNGNLETAKEQYYRAFTSYTGAVQYSSMDVQRQFYDACVASSVAGTRLGSTSINYQLCYWYTSSGIS